MAGIGRIRSFFRATERAIAVSSPRYPQARQNLHLRAPARQPSIFALLPQASDAEGLELECHHDSYTDEIIGQNGWSTLRTTS